MTHVYGICCPCFQVSIDGSWEAGKSGPVQAIKYLQK